MTISVTCEAQIGTVHAGCPEQQKPEFVMTWLVVEHVKYEMPASFGVSELVAARETGLLCEEAGRGRGCEANLLGAVRDRLA